MSAQHTPGPWRPSKWSGGEGHPAGWYVNRTNNGKTEWLKDSMGARRFASEGDAKSGIDALTKPARSPATIGG